MSNVTLLFERNPLDMTKEDLDQIVTAMRSRRAHVQSSPVKPETRGRKNSKLALVQDLDIDIQV